jgi:cysteinyl-tRNA synthetase
VAYVDVGEAESYRWYWQDDWEVGDPEWIVAPDPDGWDENYPVAYWDDEWRAIMFTVIDGLMADGYDGMYLDWLEAYSFEPVAEMAEAEGLNSEDEMVSFVNALADYARAQDPEFIMVAQNAAELGARAEYREVFDAIAQEAVWFDGGGDPDAEEQVGDVPTDAELTEEYLEYLQVWQDAAIPVWVCEYATESENVDTAYGNAAEHGFIGYVTTRPLDQLTETPPP